MKGKAAICAFLMLSAIPVGLGQDDAELEFVPMGTDAEGDINGIAGDVGIVVVKNAWAPLDLIAFDMAEDTAFGFHLQLQVASLDVTNPDNPDADGGVDPTLDQVTRSVDYTFEFKLRNQEYQLVTNYLDDSRIAESYLQRVSSDNFWETLGEVQTTIDEDLPGFQMALPSNLLAGQDGVAPRIGDKFTEMRWESYSTGPAVITLATYTAAQAVMDYYDNMPDGFSETLPTEWEVQAGSISHGHIGAFSNNPVRVSNGEATTFVYEVEITNSADYVDYVIPEWSGGNENWLVSFPSGKVRMDPSETKVIPFLVTVPFAHQHGVYYPFDVTFQSQADPESAGRVELGVRYTGIPQPAGHHPSVYLHGVESPGNSYFNTVKGEEYPEDPTETESIGGESSYGTCSTGKYSSQVYRLSPSLRMGIDMDMDAIGEATLQVYSELGSSGDVFSGFFIVSKEQPNRCYSGGIPAGAIATVDATEPISLGREQYGEVTTTITPLEHGDYLPLETGANMWLLWSKSFGSNDNSNIATIGSTEVLDDSEFFLPISEYHDDVDDYFGLLTGIDLFATNSQERYVNPGETTIFLVTAQNIGVQDTVLNLEITGSNTEWATLLGDIRIKLKPGETRDMALAVRAPSGASDGELADITLHLTNDEDESIRSLIRLLAEVDMDVDHLDEGFEAATLDAELQNAPAPFIAVPLGLLAAGLWIRRRQ